ncbi:MAG: hypothetical protein F2789_14680 [Actinobacteria bacterium]|nr:hypothetical protein [Actinomycetota bacterium]
MSSLHSILDMVRAGVHGAAELVEGSDEIEVSEVRIIDQFDQLSDAGPGSLVVLDRDLSHVAETYRFDIALRRIGGQGAVGVAVFLPPDARFSLTARVLARKAGLVLVRFDPGTDITQLLQGIARQIADKLHITVERARRACEAIGRVDTRKSSVADIVQLGSMLLGREVVLGTADDARHMDRLAVPARVTAHDGQWLITERMNDADADALVEMVLWRLAAEASRCAVEQESLERYTRRTAGEVLLQLIEADRATRVSLAPTARRVGIPIDASHVIVRIEFDNLLDLSTDDEVAAYQNRERMTNVALEAAPRNMGVWHAAHDPSMLVLLCSDEHAPALDSGLDAQRSIGRIVDQLVATTPGLRIYCGVGSARATLAGLVTSATEARLATSSARSRRRVNQPVSFDAIGLRTTLVEWYSSSSVRESIDALFAPLNVMTDTKRQQLLETLTTYLDFQSSTTQTAEALHIHRNAVRYRIRRAFELLNLDEGDPEQRLFLHLACRARQPS